MKRIYMPFLLLIAFMAGPLVSAQITVTNAVFPVAGDTLESLSIDPTTAISADLATMDVDHTWDLANLPSGVRTSTFFDIASNGENGDSFPSAELYSTSTAGGGEIYYDVFNNRIDELGRGNQDFGFGSIPIPLAYDQVAVFARAPLSFNDVYEDNSRGTVTAPKEVIPDSILALVNGFITFDSVRVSLRSNNKRSFESYGTMIIPGGSYDVLRETVNTVSTTDLALYTTNGWLPVGPALLALLGDFADFFGEQVSTSYNFYSATEKEPILSSTYDAAGVLTSLSYKALPIVVSTQRPSYYSQEINAYPNPTLGPLTFDVSGHGSGNYTVSIFNIVGMKVMEENMAIQDGSQWKTNVSHLRKGTYIYTIHTEAGEKLGTKRFIVLKP